MSTARSGILSFIADLAGVADPEEPHHTTAVIAALLDDLRRLRRPPAPA